MATLPRILGAIFQESWESFESLDLLEFDLSSDILDDFSIWYKELCLVIF